MATTTSVPVGIQGSFVGAGNYRNRLGHQLTLSDTASAPGLVVLGAILEGWLDTGSRTQPVAVLVTPEWVVSAGYRPC